jgi:nitrogen fixation/metabolism regulation signal transduction histidine kinase
MLMVDPILIEQVLINLLKNAAESIDNGRSALRATQGRAAVVPTIPRLARGRVFGHCDTGQRPGADEVMDRLYEAFYSTKSDGMGIGLKLCRSIVESHQGGCKCGEPLQWSEVDGLLLLFLDSGGLKPQPHGRAKSKPIQVPG